MADTSWRTQALDELCDAFLTLRERDEVARFLRDLCTLGELEALTHRLQVARMVSRGVPYASVAEQVGASTTTVTRVAHWLRHGEGGYRTVLERDGVERACPGRCAWRCPPRGGWPSLPRGCCTRPALASS